MLIKILYCMGYQIISPTYLMYTECNLLYRHVTYITYTYTYLCQVISEFIYKHRTRYLDCDSNHGESCKY